MKVVSHQWPVVSAKAGAKSIARASLFWLLITVLLTTAALAEAYQPKKVPRIGYLTPGDLVSESIVSEALRMALRELGYIEGQNIAIEYQYAEGKLDRFSELAAELVRVKVVSSRGQIG